MYCPRCGNQQIAKDTRYCSSCGIILSGISQIMMNDGVYLQNRSNLTTPKKEGLKRGLFLFLSTFLIVPLVALITIALNIEPFAVAAAAIITFWGGILRMIYALLFESSDPNGKTLEEKISASTRNYLNKKQNEKNLPPYQAAQSSVYESGFNRNWRDTGDFSHSNVNDRNTSSFNNSNY